jgi:hypothetical protein
VKRPITEITIPETKTAFWIFIRLSSVLVVYGKWISVLLIGVLLMGAHSTRVYKTTCSWDRVQSLRIWSHRTCCKVGLFSRQLTARALLALTARAAQALTVNQSTPCVARAGEPAHPRAIDRSRSSLALGNGNRTLSLFLEGDLGAIATKIHFNG